MAFENYSVGLSPNDGTGDKQRVIFTRIKSMLTEIYGKFSYWDSKPEIGVTSGTTFRGDLGQIAYIFSQERYKLTTPYIFTLNTNYTGITVGWSSVVGASEYSLNSNILGDVLVSSGITNYTFSGLTSGSTLNVKVKAINGSNQSDYSIILFESALSQIEKIQYFNSGFSSLTNVKEALDLTLNNGASSSSIVPIQTTFNGEILLDKYLRDYGTINGTDNSGFTFNSANTLDGSSAQIKIIGDGTHNKDFNGWYNLDDSTLYSNTLNLVNSTIFSRISNRNYYRILEQYQLPIQLSYPDVTGLTVSQSVISFNWNNIQHNSGYNYQLSNDNNTWSSNVYLSANTTSVNISSLTSGTTQYFKIQTVGSGQAYLTSNFSPSASAVTSNIVQLNIPTISGLTIDSFSAITVLFSGIDSRASFIEVDYKPTTGSTWNVFSSTLSTGLTSVQVSNLSGSTQYDFRIKAIGDQLAFSNSNYSSIVSGNTLSSESFINWINMTNDGVYDSQQHTLKSATDTGTTAIGGLKMLDGGYITSSVRDDVNEAKGWLFGLKTTNTNPTGWGTWDLELGIGYTFSVVMTSYGGGIDANGPAPVNGQIVKISRNGDNYTASYSDDGISWTVLKTITYSGDLFVVAYMGAGGNPPQPTIYNAKQSGCQTV